MSGQDLESTEIDPQISALLRRIPRQDPDECPGTGRCHGSLSWCNICGNVDRVCDFGPYFCNLHYPEDENGDIPSDPNRNQGFS